MCACMSVRVCACMPVHVRALVCACVHACVSVNTSVHVRVFVRARELISICKEPTRASVHRRRPNGLLKCCGKGSEDSSRATKMGNKKARERKDIKI